MRLNAAAPAATKAAAASAGSKKNKKSKKEKPVVEDDVSMDEDDEDGQQEGYEDELAQLRTIVLAQQRQLAELAQQLAQAATAPPAQQRGPMPKGAFDRRYKGDGGAALDDWITSAKRTRPLYTGMSEEYTLSWLAASLEGAALAWYESEYGGTKPPPASADALFEALRRRFQPIDSEQTAMQQLYTLKQGAKQSVDEYATRYLHLLSKVPELPVQHTAFQFRLGLHRAIEEKINQTTPQPATLQETIALAARIEGRTGAAASSSGDHCANVEMDATSAILARLSAMEQTIRSTAASSREQRAPYDSRRERGANKGARNKPLWMNIEGMTKELSDKRYNANQCLYCGNSQHRLRDCPVRGSNKPPVLN
jgi:hypothetical protein